MNAAMILTTMRATRIRIRRTMSLPAMEVSIASQARELPQGEANDGYDQNGRAEHPCTNASVLAQPLAQVPTWRHPGFSAQKYVPE